MEVFNLLFIFLLKHNIQIVKRTVPLMWIHVYNTPLLEVGSLVSLLQVPCALFSSQSLYVPLTYHTSVLLDLETHVHRIMKYVLVSVSFFLFALKMFLKFTCVVMCIDTFYY